MKVLITGHTNGIGKALFEKFNSEGYQVMGYSISTGYDIGNSETLDMIIEDLDSYDIFVNNAYHPVGQLELLKRAIEKWEGSDKMILNMSSKLVFFPGNNDSFNEYINVKKQMNSIIQDRQIIAFPRLLNIMPGLVDTRMATMFNAPKINTTDLANLVYTLVKLKDTISTQEIIVDVPGLNWKDITY